jgi:hypothetical protein
VSKEILYLFLDRKQKPGKSHTATTFKMCMGRVYRFLEFQNFTGSKPTFRIYVPSWLPTPVRKSRYQTRCNFLSNFETRDFCRVLRNVPSNGPRGRLIGTDVPGIFNQGSKTLCCFIEEKTKKNWQIGNLKLYTLYNHFAL